LVSAFEGHAQEAFSSASPSPSPAAVLEAAGAVAGLHLQDAHIHTSTVTAAHMEAYEAVKRVWKRLMFEGHDEEKALDMMLAMEGEEGWKWPKQRHISI
jgi:hypothetical protein